jgi:hypothetical protein
MSSVGSGSVRGGRVGDIPPASQTAGLALSSRCRQGPVKSVSEQAFVMADALPSDVDENAGVRFYCAKHSSSYFGNANSIVQCVTCLLEQNYVECDLCGYWNPRALRDPWPCEYPRCERNRYMSKSQGPKVCFFDIKMVFFANFISQVIPLFGECLTAGGHG